MATRARKGQSRWSSYLVLYAAAFLLMFLLVEWAVGDRLFALFMGLTTVSYVWLLHVYHRQLGRGGGPVELWKTVWNDCFEDIEATAAICLLVFPMMGYALGRIGLGIGFFFLAGRWNVIALSAVYGKLVTRRPGPRHVGGAKRVSDEQAREELKKKTSQRPLRETKPSTSNHRKG
jgi:hypothetical protein